MLTLTPTLTLTQAAIFSMELIARAMATSEPNAFDDCVLPSIKALQQGHPLPWPVDMLRLALWPSSSSTTTTTV